MIAYKLKAQIFCCKIRDNNISINNNQHINIRINLC